MLSVRATASTGAVVDDPSPEQILALVRELATGGDGAFLIMQGRRDRRGQAYLQAVATRDAFVVERQDATGTRMHRADATDLDSLARAFQRWADGIHDRQPVLDWTPLRAVATGR